MAGDENNTGVVEPTVINDGQPIERANTGFVGMVYAFTPGDCIETYFEHMKYLLDLNNYTDGNKKKSFLVTAIGLENFKTLINLVRPDKIEDKTFEELVASLTTHFKPKPNEISESFKFYRRKQRQDESIADYVVDLKLMANSCNFGDHRSRALRDGIVLGISSDEIRQRLLNFQGELKFDKAVEMALNWEMTQKDMKSIKNNNFATNAVHVSRKDNFSNFNSNGSNNFKSNNNFNRSKSNSNKYRSQSKNNKNSNFSSYNKNNNFPSQIKCFNCQGYDHYAKFCKKPKVSKYNGQSSRSKDGVNGISNDLNNFSVNSVNYVGNNCSALYFTLMIEGVEIQMEYDSGACVTLMSKLFFDKNFNANEIKLSNKNLKVVTGEEVSVIGSAEVNVWCEYDQSWKILSIVVVDVENDFVPLLGRNWLDVLTPKWRDNIKVNFEKQPLSEVVKNDKNFVNSVNNEKKDKAIQEIKDKFPRVFNKNLEEPIKGFQATIHMDKKSTPIFFKPYTVPYGLRDKVDQELDRLCEEKILTPVRYSQWASPIVVVPKSDGSIRMCVDCKATINKFVKTEHYPLPVIDDIFASIAGHKVFSVVDLKGAYQQLEVVDQCREILTINTQRGLMRYNRLPFGVSVAPSIFQETMDKILVGIKDVYCYLDDILVGGANFEDCQRKVHEVFERLDKHNVKINEGKCKFFEEKIEFLGFIISGIGLHPTNEKIEAIINAPQPKDLMQLQSFLGLLNYYQRFIPNLSGELHPLYELLKKDVEFIWTNERNETFEKAKRLLLKNNVLVHYDPKKPLILSCDASPYGVGAVLAHLIDGIEYPIFFASSSLSPAEKNYSQLHREALAIIFGIKKFNKYLYGLKFKIHSDHQPLREIFSENKGTPAVAAARLQRWAVLLSGYNYSIEYKKASLMAHADMLSRLPLDQGTGVDEFVINSFNQIEDIPLVAEDVANHTQNDSILSQVYKFVNEGWPKNERFDDEEVKRWSSKKANFSTENNCLYYGNRLVIPKKLIQGVLEILHKDHKGIVRMKALARGSVWWLGVDNDVEAYVKSCFVCASTQKGEKQKVYGEWTESKFPFERVHVDLFDFNKVTYLVLVDTFSKFIHVDYIKEYNAYNVIEKLRILFSIFGLPKEIVSDNGPPFNSYEFKMFFRANGINVSNSPAYHPQSNGSAERAVQTSKNSFRKFVLDIEHNFTSYMQNSQNKRRSIQMMIDNFHINYRNTPSTVTKVSPSELLFNYKPRTLIDLLRNDKNHESNNLQNGHIFEKGKKLVKDECNNKNEFDNKNKGNKVIKNKYSNEKENIKNQSNFNNKKEFEEIKIKEIQSKFIVKKEFKVNENIMYLNQFKEMASWLPGFIKKKISSLRYVIVVNNTTRVAHVNQLKKILERKVHFFPEATEYLFDKKCNEQNEVILNEVPLIDRSVSPVTSKNDEQVEVELRRSKRTIKKPQRYTS